MRAISRPDVNQIVPGLLIGSAPGQTHIRRLVAAGVTGVVDLCAEAEQWRGLWPESVQVAQIPLEEHAVPTVEQIDLAGQTVAARIGQGHVVLVHCRAGLERAPTVACAALLRMGWSLEDAYRRVRVSRPRAAITQGQQAALANLAAQLAMDARREGRVAGPTAS